MESRKLIELAHKARVQAYAPYSGYCVGAALLTKEGKVYLGSNIENASYGAANCAERTAFFKAISEGEREFEAIAIVGGRQGEAVGGMCAPCGICRQVMMEFCSPEEFHIILEDNEEGLKCFLLKDLLPFGFGPSNLGKE